MKNCHWGMMGVCLAVLGAVFLLPRFGVAVPFGWVGAGILLIACCVIPMLLLMATDRKKEKGSCCSTSKDKDADIR